MVDLPTWVVASTVKADAVEVAQFVAHHLALGASRVYLFFDDPADPSLNLCDHLERVTSVPCSTAYWQRIAGRRPRQIETRQIKNCFEVYANTKADWVLAIDVDEFVESDYNLSQLLSLMPPQSPLFRLEPFEALASEEENADVHFRRSNRHVVGGEEAVADIYGRYASFFHRGMISHAGGKCFFRTGFAGLKPKLHSAEIGEKSAPAQRFSEYARLLHFHMTDFEAWQKKLNYRLENRSYKSADGLLEFLKGATQAQRREFFEATHLATPQHREDLDRYRLLYTTNFDLTSKTKELFPRLERLSNEPFSDRQVN
jgi:hypothetical protein